MFQALKREIRGIPVHIVALFCAAPLLILLDAGRVVAHPVHPGLAHQVLVLLAALCLVAIYADGAAPPVLRAEGPWQRPYRKRRRDAWRAAILIALALLACGAAVELLKPLQPAQHLETIGTGGTLSYPDVQNPGEAGALIARFAVSLLGLAIFFCGPVAPACAALQGLRRAPGESLRAWWRFYFRLAGLTIVAFLALFPAALLSLPLQAYWSASSFGLPDPDRLQLAIDLCNRFGLGSIALGAAAATLLTGAVLWGYSRAIARIVEQPRG